MYINRHYSFWLTFNWSSRPFYLGVLYAALVTALSMLSFYFFELKISIPWQPISVLGITVGFYLGFKNNASYDRLWEARKIWGGIVNNSRSLGIALMAYSSNNLSRSDIKIVINRHIAWMTALRFQLRLAKSWEHTTGRAKNVNEPVANESYFQTLSAELDKYLQADDIEKVISKSNVAIQLLNIQSQTIKQWHDDGKIDRLGQIELQLLLQSLIDEQGKVERIKNTPFPRQYASVALWQTFIFAALIPFGLLDVFESNNIFFQLMSIFFSGLLIWVFFLMEKIGDYSENPFEGSYNDVPITSISRNIEIDLLQMINNETVPETTKPDKGYLM